MDLFYKLAHNTLECGVASTDFDHSESLLKVNVEKSVIAARVEVN